MSIRFISDLHINDIYSLEWRSKSLDDYNDHLIETWNTITAPDDIVFIVGDLGRYCPKTVDIIKELKGIKILIVGNHDYQWGNNIFRCGLFEGVYGRVTLSNAVIQHIPTDHTDITKFFIHGHHHTYAPSNMKNALKQYAHDSYRLNCAADLNFDRPCTIQELIINKEMVLDEYYR